MKGFFCCHSATNYKKVDCCMHSLSFFKKAVFEPCVDSTFLKYSRRFPRSDLVPHFLFVQTAALGLRRRIHASLILHFRMLSTSLSTFRNFLSNSYFLAAAVLHLPKHSFSLPNPNGREDGFWAEVFHPDLCGGDLPLLLLLPRQLLLQSPRLSATGGGRPGGLRRRQVFDPLCTFSTIDTKF